MVQITKKIGWIGFLPAGKESGSTTCRGFVMA